jgi:hypothetical protein
MGIKHTFVSAVADDADTSLVRPSDWNADHTIDADVDMNGFDLIFDDGAGIYDDSGNEFLIFQKTASAVNYLELTNSATGSSPANAVVLSANGSDTNIALKLDTKGSGSVICETNSFYIQPNSSSGFADAYFWTDQTGAFAETAWNGFQIGGLHHRLGSAGTEYAQFSVVVLDGTGGSQDADYRISTKVAGSTAARLRIGDGINIGSHSTYPGSGNISFADAKGIYDDSANELLIFQKTTSAAEYVEITNTASGFNPEIGPGGASANLGLQFRTKGTVHGSVSSGSFLFDMSDGIVPTAVFTGRNSGAFGGPAFVLYNDSSSPVAGDYLGGFEARGRDSAATVGELFADIHFVMLDPTNGSEDGKTIFTNNVAGGGYVVQFSTHDGVVFGSGTTYPGNGNVAFADAKGIYDGSANEQLLFQTTGSAVNYLEVTNAATGNAPELGANGSDSNVNLALRPKGTGIITIPRALATSTVREQLTASRSYYVLSTGSDTNDGLANTAGGAWLTIQHAFDEIAKLDLGNYDVNLTIGSGTFDGACLRGPIPANSGSLKVTLAGVASTYIDIIQTPAGGYYGLGVKGGVGANPVLFYGGCYINGGPGAGSWALAAVDGANMQFQGAFTITQAGGNYSNFAYMYRGGKINLRTTTIVNLNGNFYRGFYCRNQSYMQFRSLLTVGSTPKFYAGFALVKEWSGAHPKFHASSTLSGATGPRYNASNWSVINTNGSGTTYLPGNAGGSLANYSVYV